MTRELAQQGVAEQPRNAAWRRIQGLAALRAQDGPAAVAALREALALRGDNPTDGFLLALAYRVEGDSSQAQLWYDRSCGWMDGNHVRTLDLVQLRKEAAAGLPN